MLDRQQHRLFIPGRLCLFGEHTDWTGGYRRVAPEIPKGYTLLIGTNQGIYATVQPHPDRFILHTPEKTIFQVPMSADLLLAHAQRGEFFSYAAGVAYQTLAQYNIRGLEIEIDRTDLPIKKGLSSSAAICVLVARAFNLCYGLHFDWRTELELAYQGEITTPSRCGRMDFACAFGERPILMEFDGDDIEVTPIFDERENRDRSPLLFLIVDLAAEKNTQEILRDLNHCYPHTPDTISQNVRDYFGTISPQITQAAVKALRQKDGAQIGQLMRQAQLEFDRCVLPACPAQLTAPILHSLLSHPPLKPYIWGGKGVGSQGDGTAQFIVKDEASRNRAIGIIQNDFPQMTCLNLTIS
jgi:mevalonate kinase